MCMVSAITPQIKDYLYPQLGGLGSTNAFPDPRIGEIARDLKDVLTRLERLDKAMGLKDCKEEESSKAALFAKIDELSKLAKDI